MISKFDKIYKQLLLQQTGKATFEEDATEKGYVDPKTISNPLAKLLLKYNVNLDGYKNNKNKKNALTTAIAEHNIIINGVNYTSIYDNIVTLNRFKKIYPGISKDTCKLWSVLSKGRSTEKFKALSTSASVGKVINNSIEKAAKFEQQIQKKMQKTIHEDFGRISSSKHVSTSPNTTIQINKFFAMFYVDENNTILKPSNISDQIYNKFCNMLAKISLGLDDSIDQGLDKLKTANGIILSSLVKQQVKQIVKKQSQGEQNNPKEAAKNLYTYYKKVGHQYFNKLDIAVQTTPWGEKHLKNIIQQGNQQVKSGQVDISFLDINFVFGKTMSGTTSQDEKHSNE